MSLDHHHEHQTDETTHSRGTGAIHYFQQHSTWAERTYKPHSFIIFVIFWSHWLRVHGDINMTRYIFSLSLIGCSTFWAMTYSHKVYKTIHYLSCNSAKMFLYIDLTKFFTGRLNNKFVLRLLTTPPHTRLTALCPGLPGVSQYQKGKTNLEFTEARDSGISWAICKSAPCSRQITMPTPHHSVFLQARCPSCRPTNSVKALKALLLTTPQHLKCVAMLPCDLSLITTLVWDCCSFSDSTDSQGSLLMHIRCGETFNNHFAANLLQNLPVKKCEKQLRTGGVKVTRLVSPFLVHGIRNIILILMLPQLSREVGYVWYTSINNECNIYLRIRCQLLTFSYCFWSTPITTLKL